MDAPLDDTRPTLRRASTRFLSLFHALELRGEVVLQLLADGGHVEGPVEVAVHQAVEPVSGGVLLRRGGARDGVGAQLDLAAVDLAEPDLDDAGRVREDELDLVVRLRPPVAVLAGQRSNLLA